MPREKHHSEYPSRIRLEHMEDLQAADRYRVTLNFRHFTVDNGQIVVYCRHDEVMSLFSDCGFAISTLLDYPDGSATSSPAEERPADPA